MDEVAVVVVLGDAGGLAEFVERALVGHGIDPLADGLLAKEVLALDLVRSAQRLGECFAAPQLGNLRLPAHPAPCSVSPPRVMGLLLSTLDHRIQVLAGYAHRRGYGRCRGAL